MSSGPDTAKLNGQSKALSTAAATSTEAAATAVRTTPSFTLPPRARVASDKAKYGKRRPCYQHEGKSKKKCLKAHKRSRMDWPPNPTQAEIKKRVGWWWPKAERISYCETAGNWQHFPNGNYIGGLGMFRRTYGIGQAVTGYRWVHEGASKAEQIAIGHVVMKRFGVMAWGCGSA